MGIVAPDTGHCSEPIKIKGFFFYFMFEK
jgi:hypothetical protein